MHPNQITDWKNQLQAKAADVFGGEPRADELTVDIKVLRRIDELHLELPFAGARMLRDLLRAEGLVA